MATVHEVLGSKVQLYQRKNSPYWWCATTVGGARHRLSTKKTSLSEATAFAKDWALHLNGAERWGGGAKKEGKSFKVAAERFLDEFELMTRGERSPEYVRYHRGRVKNHLIPFFGDMTLAEITAGRIDEYRLHRFKVGPLPRGRKPSGADAAAQPTEPVKRLGRSTLHQEIVCLRQILKMANRLGWLTALPDMSAPYKGSGKVDHRAWFSPQEYKALYTRTRELAQTPPAERWRESYEELHDCVLFLGNSGLRPDEALSIAIGDVTVEFDEATRQRILAIEVHGKRGYGPCKTMPGAVIPFRRIIQRRTATVRAQREAAGDVDWQTATPSPTTPLFPSLPRTFLNNVLEELKLKTDRDGRPRTFYSLRHTYICLRLLDGAHAYELAKNCRTSVEMLEQHYAIHLKNYIDTTLVNTRSGGGERRHRAANNINEKDYWSRKPKSSLAKDKHRSKD